MRQSLSSPLLLSTLFLASGGAVATPEVTVSGLLELELSSSEGFDPAPLGGAPSYDRDNRSDLRFATAFMKIGSQVNDSTYAEISLLYEEDYTPLEIDAAMVVLGNSEVSPWSLQFGQIYLPSGNFTTNMIDYTLPQDLLEIREAGLQLNYADSSGLYGSAYLFAGEVEKRGNNANTNGFGAQLGWRQEHDAGSIDVGVSLLNNLANGRWIKIKGLDSASGGGTLQETGINDEVAAYALHANAQWGDWGVASEYASASSAFHADDIAFNGHGAQPAAWNIEGSYQFVAATRPMVLAVGLQGSREAYAIGLPEQELLINLTLALVEGTSLRLEYNRYEDYAVTDGGSGEQASRVIARISTEF